ncbi:MAG: hypothetical protein NTX59_07240 [Elusimicrobia bacterium]|nr:hypothetical protein [Elusimicrobiota bacterium]
MDDEARLAAFQKLAGQNPSGGFFGFSPWAIAVGVLFSLVGLFYFKRGKQEMDIPTISAGIALMAFPYFVSDTLYMLLTGAAIMALHYMARKYW